MASSPIRIAASLVVAIAAVSLSSHARPEPPRVEPPKAPESSAVRALRQGQSVVLDRATAADLELLPGIGPAIARRIVESRTAEGPFRSVDDLDRVKGIGERTVERLRPFVTVAAGSVGIEDPRDPEPGRDREEVDRGDVPNREHLGTDLATHQELP
jgi:competence ComEA-like helix-hairpin-helix protein